MLMLASVCWRWFEQDCHSWTGLLVIRLALSVGWVVPDAGGPEQGCQVGQAEQEHLWTGAMICNCKHKTFYYAYSNKDSLYAEVVWSADDWVSSNGFSSQQEWLQAGALLMEVEFGWKLERSPQKTVLAVSLAYVFTSRLDWPWIGMIAMS